VLPDSPGSERDAMKRAVAGSGFAGSASHATAPTSNHGTNSTRDVEVAGLCHPPENTFHPTAAGGTESALG
jgi:hypothetical protein